MARSASSRDAALDGIRTISFIVGVLAATAGIVYAITTVVGPQVLWLVGGPPELSGLVTLRWELRLVHAAAVLLAAATVTIMAFLLADLARLVRTVAAFVPAVSRTAWSLAIVLAVGSWLARIAANVAANSGVIYPDTGDGTTIDPATLPLRWEAGPFAFAPDLPFLGLALVLALLASIIQSGERLQRDTEGLV